MNQIGKEEIAEKGDCLKQNAGADRKKQAVHEKRMKQIGTVQVPQKAFLAVLKLD